MEMTMISPIDLVTADFSNRAGGTILQRSTVAGALFGFCTGLGSPGWGRWAKPGAVDPVAHAPFKVENAAMVDPAAELVPRIKEGWSLNMTELADIIGVTRPTIYNWLKGKGAPDAKLLKHLQTLAATAADWTGATAGSNWDFLLDYTGPKADEVTIRETLGRVDVNPGEIRELVHLRMNQYREAYARSREILGDPKPITGEPIRESARKLNKRWTEHAQRLHRARNASR
jgi:transcriptional regulator with XRE-family HTH domain